MELDNYYWVLCKDGEDSIWKIIYIDLKTLEILQNLPYYSEVRGPILLEHYLGK